jgi:hypothetical protein
MRDRRSRNASLPTDLRTPAPVRTDAVQFTSGDADQAWLTLAAALGRAAARADRANPPGQVCQEPATKPLSSKRMRGS